MKSKLEFAKLTVIDVLQNLEGQIKPKKRNPIFGIDSLAMLGIRARDPPAKAIRRCHWIPPCMGRLALNVDGSMIDSKAAVGGVIRDHTGEFCGAFAGPVGFGTTLHAEILALHHGLQLAQHLGLRDLDIWSDSQVLVNKMGQRSPLWQMADVWKQIHETLNHSGISLRHTLREGDHGADRFSKWGHSLDRVVFFLSYDEIPPMIKEVLEREARDWIAGSCSCRGC